MRKPHRILVLVLSLILVFCGLCAGAATWIWNGAALDTSGRVAFVNPLPVPPLAPSHIDGSGRRVFDLRAAAGVHDFGGRTSPTWGFNGSYLGPTLRAARGERVVVNVHNGLTETTTVHWHGMHLPAAMDGGPHQMVAPGATWSPTWTVEQPAATLWYHPHPHGQTASHVYRGLAGMFILDDPGGGAGLPNRYGIDDIPVIVQDRRFGPDGLDDEPLAFTDDIGFLGDTVVVNGAVGPYLDVTTERVRLRLLNASNARAYGFGLADDREFAMVASDGGLLAAPYRTNRLTLAPGERAEIVVALRAGERVVLRSFPPDLGLNPIGRRFVGGADTLDILELRAAATLAPGPPLPRRLAELPAADPTASVEHRSFRLAGHAINGKRMDMSRVDATVAPGSREVWEVVNGDGAPHSFHVHGVSFRVLTADGSTPRPELAGWKDTVFLRPDVRYEILIDLPRFADPRVPYMFHCHVLEHEDRGMMGQFLVVGPGAMVDPGAPPHGAHT
jgi:FtsP/CotA-like multicopper oxidase with cupredoxin domain